MSDIEVIARGNHIKGYTGIVQCVGHVHPTTKEARAHVTARMAELEAALEECEARYMRSINGHVLVARPKP